MFSVGHLAASSRPSLWQVLQAMWYYYIFLKNIAGKPALPIHTTRPFKVLSLYSVRTARTIHCRHFNKTDRGLSTLLVESCQRIPATPRGELAVGFQAFWCIYGCWDGWSATRASRSPEDFAYSHLRKSFQTSSRTHIFLTVVRCHESQVDGEQRSNVRGGCWAQTQKTPISKRTGTASGRQ